MVNIGKMYLSDSGEYHKRGCLFALDCFTVEGIDSNCFSALATLCCDPSDET